MVSRAIKRMKKVKKVPHANVSVILLARVTGAKGKSKKSPFSSLRRYIRGVAQKKAAAKRPVAKKPVAKKPAAKKPARKSRKTNKKKSSKN